MAPILSHHMVAEKSFACSHKYSNTQMRGCVQTCIHTYIKHIYTYIHTPYRKQLVLDGVPLFREHYVLLSCRHTAQQQQRAESESRSPFQSRHCSFVRRGGGLSQRLEIWNFHGWRQSKTGLYNSMVCAAVFGTHVVCVSARV